MKKLYIDTTDTDKTEVKLFSDKNSVSKLNYQFSGKRKVLETINVLLRKNHTPTDKLSEISVITGPGSFTGLRSGIVISRVLGFLLGIKVNGKNPIKEITPQYTKSKFD